MTSAPLSPRAEEVGRWLAREEGVARPGEVGAALELDHNAQARALAELKGAGLISRSKREVRLTTAGWSRFLPFEQEHLGEALDQALSLWPYAQQAFLELLVSAVVARHHLGSSRPSRHLGFMVIGETGTGKSAMAEMVCWLFGWRPAEHVRWLARETKGSLLGRRAQAAGGAMAFQPAAVLDLAFVCFDEFDKGDEPIRRAVWPFFQGELELVLEDALVISRPTPMLAANPPESGARLGQLRPEYRRRSVVLDVGTDPPAHLGRRLRELYAVELRAPAIDLARVTPPGETLPDAALAVLELIPRALTETGRKEFPGVDALELATLGRAALLGPDADLQVAAYAIGCAYLTCAETLPDRVAAGWQLDLHAIRDALGPETDLTVLERVFALQREASAQRERAARARQVAQQQDDLALVRRRGELLETLRLELLALRAGGIPREHRVQAAGLRAQLKQLTAQVRKSLSESNLDLLEQHARAVLRGATELCDGIALEASRRADDAQLQRQANQRASAQAKRDAEALRTARRQRERAGREQQRQTTAWLRELKKRHRRKTTRAGEDVLAGLVELSVVRQQIREHWVPDGVASAVARVLTFQQRPRPEPAPTARTLRVPATAPPDDGRHYRREVATSYLDAAGSAHHADELRSWESPTVKRVLELAAEAHGLSLDVETTRDAQHRARGP